MLISDLPIELRQLAYKRQRDQGNSGNFDGYLSCTASNNNFDWAQTPEGNSFWNNVDEGRSVTHYDCYPKPPQEINDYEIC